MVTICTTRLTFSNSTFCPHSIFMCFVWIWEQTAISVYTSHYRWLFKQTDAVSEIAELCIFLLSLQCNVQFPLCQFPPAVTQLTSGRNTTNCSFWYSHKLLSASACFLQHVMRHAHTRMRNPGTCNSSFLRATATQVAKAMMFWKELTFKTPCVLYIGQSFRYSSENAFYVFNQQIYFIIWYVLDRTSLI